MFEKGSEKLENALDTRTIIRHQRALRVLMTIFLSQTSRKLIHLQRRTTVLDFFDRKKPPGESSTSSDALDSEEEALVLSKLRNTPKRDEGPYEVVLRRGVAHPHPTTRMKRLGGPDETDEVGSHLNVVLTSPENARGDSGYKDDSTTSMVGAKFKRT